jgi:hypothetical protein
MPDFLWGIAVSGSWDDASNWSDTSTGQTPALVAPGSNDSVTVNAVGDGAARVITGTGNSASLTLNGATVLAGQFTTGALSQAYNQTLQLNAGDELTITGNASFGTSTNSSIINLTLNGGTLTAGSLTTNRSIVSIIQSGTLLVTGNVTDSNSSEYLLTGGTFTVDGTFTSQGNSIDANTGSHVQLTGLTLGTNGGVYLYFDSTSSLEVGIAGNAAAGSITIDGGVSVTESGQFFAPSIVDNGTIIVASTSGSNGLALLGSLSGDGQIAIGTGAVLTLSAVASASPTISGFNSSNAIDFEGTVSNTKYANGILTLYDGSTAVANLNLSGDYSGETFLTAAVAPGVTQIALPEESGDVPPSVTAPQRQTVAQNVPSLISGIVIGESTPGVNVRVAVSDGTGLLIANTSAADGGGTITGAGTKNLTIVGTLAQINADLSTLLYEGPIIGADNITVSANDGLGGVADAQIAISVEPVGTPPTFSGVPTSVSFTEEGGAVRLAPNLSVADANNLNLASASVSITGGTFPDRSQTSRLQPARPLQRRACSRRAIRSAMRSPSTISGTRAQVVGISCSIIRRSAPTRTTM